MTEAASSEDGWTPEFPGQRPPFPAGHEYSMVHGARSERRIAPVAAQIEAGLLAMPSCPPYLREPAFRDAVRAYCRAQACVELLTEWLSGRDLTAALGEHEEHEETEENAKGTTTRRGTSRRVQSVLDVLHKHETRASSLRARLGLDPASQARISRDLSASAWYSSAATPLDTALAEAEERRALAAGGAGD